MFYSANEKGFFDPEMGGEIPDDGVLISATSYFELMAGQAAGKRIAADQSGRPILVSPPAGVPVPQAVSRFQGRVALHDAGILEAAEAAVSSADQRLKIAWADASEWRRDSPTIASIAAALGLSETQVDDLFRAAAQITA